MQVVVAEVCFWAALPFPTRQDPQLILPPLTTPIGAGKCESF